MERATHAIYRFWRISTYKQRYGKQLKVGSIYFRANFRINISTKEASVEIGDGCFFNNDCSLNAHQRIRIGKNCLFGENVRLYDHNHCYKDLNRHIAEQGYTCADIIIEDDCWIGSNVVILKGVHIGRHSVIGAGVIVAKDVPENTVLCCKQEIIYTCL